MKPGQNIQELHALYCSITKMDVALRFNRESAWVEFVRAGFSKADLELVLRRLLRLVQCGDRRIECLKFSNVIEGLDRFEEELAVIKLEGTGFVHGEKQMSVMELYRIVEAKRVVVDRLQAAHANEDAFGLSWDSPGAKAEYRTLKSEITALERKIASMA